MRTTSDAELASHLRLALARTARRLRQEAGTGLSPSLTAALATVERCGPLTPSELAGLERVARPTVTRVLARLEEAGLISRTPDPATGARRSWPSRRRAPRCSPTARTRKDAFLSERLDGLSPADRATLARAAALLEGLLE